jgi:type I restriction-modification system DNA methylase subunit
MSDEPRTISIPLRRMTQAELDSFLETAADILRGNVDHSEFRGDVFALLFFKRISDIFEESVRHLENDLGPELARDPAMQKKVLPFMVPADSTWDMVTTGTKVNPVTSLKLGQSLNDAMLAIERANAPKFDGILTNKIDFNKTDELPRDKLVRLKNRINLMPHRADYVWLSKLYMVYRKKFYPLEKFETSAADGAKTREMIRDHVDDDPQAEPLSEKLKRIINQKRNGTLQGIALISSLEGLAAEVVDLVNESKKPVHLSIAYAAREINGAIWVGYS